MSRSRTAPGCRVARAAMRAPQSLQQLQLGTRKEGYGVGVGSGVGFVARTYLVSTTATAGGSTVELQAKLARSDVEAVGY